MSMASRRASDLVQCVLTDDQYRSASDRAAIFC